MLELFSSITKLKKNIHFLQRVVQAVPRRLKLYRVADLAQDLLPGALGIPEPRPGLPEVSPEVIDWALVPGLAFDELGFRVGWGAVYYDRLLFTRCARKRSLLGEAGLPELPVG